MSPVGARRSSRAAAASGAIPVPQPRRSPRKRALARPAGPRPGRLSSIGSIAGFERVRGRALDRSSAPPGLAVRRPGRGDRRAPAGRRRGQRRSRLRSELQGAVAGDCPASARRRSDEERFATRGVTMLWVVPGERAAGGCGSAWFDQVGVVERIGGDRPAPRIAALGGLQLVQEPPCPRAITFGSGVNRTLRSHRAGEVREHRARPRARLQRLRRRRFKPRRVTYSS